PCAMGLATPAAIMAGANAAAERGILIRDGVALERAGAVTAVMFDKTGTLTMGKPSVVKVWDGFPENSKLQGAPAPEISGPPLTPALLPSEVERENRRQSEHPSARPLLVDLAAALARHSSHPLSGAVA